MTWRSLINFLREHEGEWWSPNEIAKEIKSDIRTTKNGITANRLWHYYTFYEGWRLDVAERGKRIYAVRAIRDLEGSRAKIKADISEVQGWPEENLEDIASHTVSILRYANLAEHESFQRYLKKAQNPESKIRSDNHEKLTKIIQSIKKYRLDNLNKYLSNLVS